jgi:hypothetical protein
MVDGPEQETGMSERAIEFVALAAQCVEAAKAEGIPESEIKDAFDDLAAFIAGEIQEVNTDRGAN